MSDIFDRVNNILDGKMNFGLKRIRGLLDRLGSPDVGLKIAHIAGTNGKGSVAEYLTQMLVASGKRVGTFTSPAVINVNEQVRIDGKPLEGTALASYMERAFALRADCTAFEVLTAAAFLAFKEQDCEYAVIECGLGGSGDATNAIKHKEVAIITSIGLEHTAVLGDSIEQICAQKAGIVNSCPLVVSSLQTSKATEFFKGMGAIFAIVSDIEVNADGTSFTYGGKRYKSPLNGRVQAYNAATAIEAAHVLKLSENAIKEGISSAKISGRLQVMSGINSTFIIDGAHNPQAIAALADFIRERNYRDVKAVFGCFKDKDVNEILRILSGVLQSVVAVEPASDRAMKIDDIIKACKKYFVNVDSADSVESALSRLNGTIVVCGSFTLAKEALKWIEKRQ